MKIEVYNLIYRGKNIYIYHNYWSNFSTTQSKGSYD